MRAGGGQPAGGDCEGLRPRRRTQLAVVATNKRVSEPVGGGRVVEREPVLVSDPLLVDLGVVAGEATHHLAATVVDADRSAAGVVLGDGGDGDEVERAGPEAVLGAGQRSHRADLDGVAGEVAFERLLLVDADLLQGTALEKGDERVAGDLLGEAGAASAQDAALPVEEDLRRDVDRLGERALDAREPGLTATVGHRLVLQRALAALVADGAVQRMVDEQELHDALLRLVRGRARGLGADDHALGHRAACRTPAASASGGRMPRRPGRISTRHCRQAPTGASNGWSQNRGIWTPTCSAARMTRVSLGTLTSMPSMVTVTRSLFSTPVAEPVVTVMRWLPALRRPSRLRGRTGSRRA